MEEYTIQKEVVDFLYNGCVAFFPEVFFPGEERQPVVFYSGLNREKFEKLIKEIARTEDINSAIQTIREWKVKSDRGGPVKPTVPVNIEELIEFSEREKEKKREAIKEGGEKAKEFIKKTSRQAIKRIEAEKERGTATIDPNKIRVEKEEVELTSPVPLTTVKLSKEQQRIIEYAHRDPQKFADELTERIIKTSGINPQNPLEIESAKTLSKIFTIKLAEIDPNVKEIVVDSFPFEVLSIFSNPQNEIFASTIPDEKTREKIAQVTQGLAGVVESDTTLAANLINQATGVDFSPFFIPTQIRELKEISEEQKGKAPGVNVNIRSFLEQIARAQNLQRQIRKAVIDDKTYNNLTRVEKAKMDEEIKRASSKISSMSRAFGFLTGRSPFLENTNFGNLKTGWLSVHFSTIGINTDSFSFITSSLNFGSFSSSNILQSPIFNFAFDKFIQKLPVATKLKSVVSGLTTKLSQKAIAKIAATKIGAKITAALASNIIPVVGQVISFISSLSLIKDVAIWIKKNTDKIPYIIAGLLVGIFSLTGAPLFLIGGLGIAGYTSRAAIGEFVLSIFSAIGTVVVASLAVPILVVFIGLPILIALIMFIINSSAYVYPPSTKFASMQPGAVINQYIEVKKLAYSEDHSDKPKSTSLEFENSDLPLEITYEITITAKKGTLTNIKIEESCNVTKEASPPPCPSPDPPIPNGSNIPEITPSSSYVFTYKRSFDRPSFEDTLTIDTITVTADAPEENNISSSGSASVKIGNPPEECPSDWPIMPEGSESFLTITQGPHGTFSHSSIEAIDVGATTGHKIIATHSGTASVVRTSSAYRPLYIDIQSICNEKTIITRYAHLSAASVSTGQIITKGQIIGLSGSDGTGPHLHYEFRQNLKMAPPYIPKPVPPGCSSNCGTIP